MDAAPSTPTLCRDSHGGTAGARNRLAPCPGVTGRHRTLKVRHIAAIRLCRGRGRRVGCPDRQNRPVTSSTDDPLAVSAPELELSALHESLAASWGLEGELTAVHGERDRNFRVDATTGRYLLKVHNPADPAEVLDFQDSALRHIRAVAPDVP